MIYGYEISTPPDRVFWSSWSIFCTFTPLTAWKKKLSKTCKKTPGDIIILHKCTKNHDHRLYCSWDMARDRCNCYFFILGYFLPFYPSNCPKNKNERHEKKKTTTTLEISSFYTSVPKIMIICYTVFEIWHVTDVIVVFHFG